jgi:hypothetical protein
MAQEARNSAGNYSIQKYFPVFREFIEKIQ